jgi:hypothetical protein
MSQDISPGIIKLGISEYQVGTKIALHKCRQLVLELGLQPSFPRDSLLEEFARGFHRLKYKQPKRIGALSAIYVRIRLC